MRKSLINEKIKVIFIGFCFLTVLYSCENSGITSEFETVKTKNLILHDESGNTYKVVIESSDSGEKRMVLEPISE